MKRLEMIRSLLSRLIHEVLFLVPEVFQGFPCATNQRDGVKADPEGGPFRPVATSLESFCVHLVLAHTNYAFSCMSRRPRSHALTAPSVDLLHEACSVPAARHNVSSDQRRLQSLIVLGRSYALRTCSGLQRSTFESREQSFH